MLPISEPVFSAFTCAATGKEGERRRRRASSLSAQKQKADFNSLFSAGLVAHGVT